MVLLSLRTSATNDPVLLTKSYISWYADEAINQMIEHKIPASVILAQAIFESRCGNSQLAKKSNNHFGIKCHVEWGGDTVTKTDDTLNECFRKYKTVEESYTDHSLFLKSRSRYAHLFELKVTDYKGWCRGLKAAGYATFPGYAEALIKIIEENKLYLFDAYESIEPGLVIQNKEVVKSKLMISYFTLKDFVKSGALFADEQNTLIRSLDLITEPETDLTDVIADK
jgi:flagellum-specific peptidoglycan hydrolase FlgJ